MEVNCYYGFIKFDQETNPKFLDFFKFDYEVNPVNHQITKFSRFINFNINLINSEFTSIS